MSDTEKAPVSLGELLRARLAELQAWAKLHPSGFGDGFRRLCDGSDSSGYEVPREGDRSLIPGELHDVNGKWVPVDSPIQSAIARVNARNDSATRAFLERQQATAEAICAAHAPEPKRPPLTWATHTPFNPFPGFRCNYETQEHERAEHPLQQLSDTTSALVLPAHGSAHLLA